MCFVVAMSINRLPIKINFFDSLINIMPSHHRGVPTNEDVAHVEDLAQSLADIDYHILFLAVQVQRYVGFI
jgi:hypothetical protein